MSALIGGKELFERPLAFKDGNVNIGDFYTTIKDTASHVVAVGRSILVNDYARYVTATGDGTTIGDFAFHVNANSTIIGYGPSRVVALSSGPGSIIGDSASWTYALGGFIIGNASYNTVALGLVVLSVDAAQYTTHVGTMISDQSGQYMTSLGSTMTFDAGCAYDVVIGDSAILGPSVILSVCIGHNQSLLGDFSNIVCLGNSNRVEDLAGGSGSAILIGDNSVIAGTGGSLAFNIAIGFQNTINMDSSGLYGRNTIIGSQMDLGGSSASSFYDVVATGHSMTLLGPANHVFLYGASHYLPGQSDYLNIYGFGHYLPGPSDHLNVYGIAIGVEAGNSYSSLFGNNLSLGNGLLTGGGASVLMGHEIHVGLGADSNPTAQLSNAGPAKFTNNDYITFPNGLGGTIDVELWVSDPFTPTPGRYVADIRLAVTPDDVAGAIGAVVEAQTGFGRPGGGSGFIGFVQDYAYVPAGSSGNGTQIVPHTANLTAAIGSTFQGGREAATSYLSTLIGYAHNVYGPATRLMVLGTEVFVEEFCNTTLAVGSSIIVRKNNSLNVLAGSAIDTGESLTASVGIGRDIRFGNGLLGGHVIAIGDTLITGRAQPVAAQGFLDNADPSMFVNNDFITFPDGLGGTVDVELWVSDPFVPTPGRYVADIRLAVSAMDVGGIIAITVLALTGFGLPSGGSGPLGYRQVYNYVPAGASGNGTQIVPNVANGALAAVGSTFAGGYDASSLDQSTVVGHAITAYGPAYGVQAYGLSMNIGQNSSNSTLIGSTVNVADNSDRTVAIGCLVSVGSLAGWSVAVGNAVYISDAAPYAVVIGSQCSSVSYSGICIGLLSNIFENSWEAISIGRGSYIEADSPQAIAFGWASKVLTGSTASISVGYNATVHATVSSSIAFGDTTVVQTGAHSSVVLGRDVAILDDSYDSVRIGHGGGIYQDSSSSVDIGPYSNIGHDSPDGIVIGHGASIPDSSPYAIAVGASTTASTYSVSIGASAQIDASSNECVCIGRGAVILGTAYWSTVIGNYCSAGFEAPGSVIVGRASSSGSNAYDSIVIGVASSTGDRSHSTIAIGPSIAIPVDCPYSIAIGTDTVITGGSAIAIGWNATAGSGECVIGNSSIWGDAVHTFVVRGHNGVVLDTIKSVDNPGANETGLTVVYNDGATIANKTLKAIALGSLPVGALVAYFDP